MNWHKLDPTLSMLAHAFDSNATLHHFAQQTGGTTARQPLTRCRRQSVDYKPGRRCTVTYLLGNEVIPCQTIGVVEVRPAGITHRLFTDDPQLASVATAVDADALTAQWATAAPTWGEIESIVPIRYKPGARCTLRYRLRTDHRATDCFGKLLAQDGDALAQAVQTLYQARQVTPALPGIAQPLAYWPTLQLLVQTAVAGQELHDLAFDPQQALATRIGWMRAAGRATAALHGASLAVAGPQQNVAGDLDALIEYQPALRQLNPPLARRFAQIIALVDKVAQQQHELPAVLSHGALRTDQFMIEDDHLVLIDLDSLCWSSPARDLGNFLAYLTWKALRQPQHARFIQLGQQAFLEGYQSSHPLPAAHWITLYQVVAILKILGRRYTGLTYQEWPLTEELSAIAIKLMCL